MVKSIFFYAIILILLFTIYGSFNLSLVDFQKKDVCPKVLGVPACIIVLLFFVLTLVFHIFQNIGSSHIWYYGMLSIPFMLALSGTLTELSGKVICPRTSGGTPMCYISLGFCVALIILKFLENRIA